jgi:hypothetical protein
MSSQTQQKKVFKQSFEGFCPIFSVKMCIIGLFGGECSRTNKGGAMRVSG